MSHNWVWKFMVGDKVLGKDTKVKGTVLGMNSNNDYLERRYYVKFGSEFIWRTEDQLEKG